MNVTLDIDSEAFAQSVGAELAALKVPCQAAMADVVFETTRSNFGASGKDRPIEWEALRDERYAKKVGRDYATLHLKGTLEESIDLDSSNEDAAIVFCMDEPVYAKAHQEGIGNMPERPFFPIIPKSNDLTPATTAECLSACAAVLEERLR